MIRVRLIASIREHDPIISWHSKSLQEKTSAATYYGRSRRSGKEFGVDSAYYVLTAFSQFQEIRVKR